MSKIIRQSMVAAFAAAVGFSAFAFRPDMGPDAVQAEVQQRLQRGEKLLAIASAGKNAGISASVLTVALIAQGQESSAVVTALVRNGLPANEVVSAAASTGQNYNAMFAAALNGGADPASITPPTAAGGGGFGGGGFGGGGFGGSSGPTYGGGGGGGVSRS